MCSEGKLRVIRHNSEQYTGDSTNKILPSRIILCITDTPSPDEVKKFFFITINLSTGSHDAFYPKTL